MDKTTKIIRIALIVFGCVMAAVIAFVVVHEEAPQLFEKPQTEIVDTVAMDTISACLVDTLASDTIE